MGAVWLSLSLWVGSAALAQPEPLGLPAGSHAVGFRLLEERDESRLVTGGTAARAHARPVRVYVWYPARNGARPMRFGRYAALADDDVWPPEIAGNLRDVLEYSRRPLSRSLDAADLDALRERPVAAAEDARPSAGPFPLVVIGQGLYYESPIAFAALAEYLAGRGFVVATAPLVGTNSPIVRVDTEDLETQVRDLEFVIARVRRLPFVSADALGILGFDQGGMAGVILAMRNPDVDAFVSLDSGIVYPHSSGLPRSAPSYDPLALTIPWLHATSPRGATPPPGAESDSLLDAAAHANRYSLVVDGMGHVDFTSYALITNRRAMVGYWAPATAERAALHAIVARYVASFFAAFLLHDAEHLAFLAEDPEATFPESSVMLEHRAATPASIGYDELVQSIVNGDAERATAALRAALEARPSPTAFDQEHLQRLAISLLFTWGLAAEALPVIEFTAERYPDSAEAQALLAEGYALAGNYAAAIEALDQYLQRYPDDAGARARREQVQALQSQGRP